MTAPGGWRHGLARAVAGTGRPCGSRTAMALAQATSAILLVGGMGTASTGAIVPVERPEPSGRPSPVVDAIDLGGAVLLDIDPAGASSPANLTPVGDTLFFSATRDGRTTLWRTDGTAAGTVEVSRRPDLTCGFDDFCDYFGVQLLPTGKDLLVLTKAGLWRTDGTELGTILLGVGPIGASAATGDGLFFIADDRAHGAELWHTDGTVAGTRIVRDILPGPEGGACPATGGDFCLDSGAPVAWTGDRVVLPASVGRHGLEPWVSDGTARGTRLLRGIGPGGQGGACARPTNDFFCLVRFHPAPGGVLFWAQDRQHGAEPWWTDGTPKGTHLVADLRRGRGSSMPGWAPPASLGDRVVFLADAGHGEGLWVTDGTPRGTRLLLGGGRGTGAACQPTCSLEVMNDAVVGAGDRAYLVLRGSEAAELWSTDGTVEGTAWVASITLPSDESLPLLAPVGSSLVFVTEGSRRIVTVRITDGTASGTHDLGTIAYKGTRDPECGGPCDRGEPGEIAVAGEHVFLSIDDGTHGRELWVLPLPPQLGDPIPLTSAAG